MGLYNFISHMLFFRFRPLFRQFFELNGEILSIKKLTFLTKSDIIFMTGKKNIYRSNYTDFVLKIFFTKNVPFQPMPSHIVYIVIVYTTFCIKFNALTILICKFFSLAKSLKRLNIIKKLHNKSDRQFCLNMI